VVSEVCSDAVVVKREATFSAPIEVDDALDRTLAADADGRIAGV
jgi:hypothetical protein